MLCDICGVDVGSSIRMRGHKSGHARKGKPRGPYNNQEKASEKSEYKRHLGRYYWVVSSQWGHPLANHNGQVSEHRFVLYKEIGPGLHPCTWCGKSLSWLDKTLCVDHLDGDKLNNDKENLVPACTSCNTKRGHVLIWLRDINREDLIAELCMPSSPNGMAPDF